MWQGGKIQFVVLISQGQFDYYTGSPVTVNSEDLKVHVLKRPELSWNIEMLEGLTGKIVNFQGL